FSTLLTINDNFLRAKAEIASTIIKFLEARITNLSYNDILTYQQEFQKQCYKQVKAFATLSRYNKIQTWAEMSEYQFEVFQYETLNPKKMSLYERLVILASKNLIIVEAISAFA
ncbi:hypothetical protein ACUOCP_44805, partial [Escherichia sp. R-CC3]